MRKGVASSRCVIYQPLAGSVGGGQRGSMTSAKKRFEALLKSDWIPSFCNDQRRRNGFVPEGFQWSTCASVTEFDARWFLTAVDADLVTESEGFFVAPRSRASEQIFWSGATSASLRSFTLWLEPVITIGALARLHLQFGWPKELLGCQSEGWSLDLVAYDRTGCPVIGCEVKKSERELDSLVALMCKFALDSTLPEPDAGQQRNAWRKMAYVRSKRPRLFWAVGPDGIGHAFQVVCIDESGAMELCRAPEAVLHNGAPIA